MTISGTGGIFSISPQSAKVGNGTFTDPNPWRRFRTTTINVAPVQLQDILPIEAGGPIAPNYGFKSGTFFGGEVELIPRTAGDLGFLLYAMMGASTSVNVTGTAFRHDFILSSDGGLTLPWMACRRFVPGPSGQTLGELAWDCKLAEMQLNFGNMGITSARLGIVGRRWQHVNNPSWAYSSSAEDGTTTPILGNGHLKMEGLEYPIVGGQITMNNVMTPPDQEMIVGSYYPDDFIPLYRMLQVRIIYKYDNPTFYQKILNDGGTQFSPMPLETKTTGPNFGFDLSIFSPFNIGSTTQKYGLRITADRMIWQPGAPLEISAGQIVTQEFIGTALLPTSGEYARFSLFNNQSSFTWP